MRRIIHFTEVCWILCCCGLMCPRSAMAGSRGNERAQPGWERFATLGDSDCEDEFPAIGTDETNNVWVCWVSFDGQSDVVLAAKLVDGTALPSIVLSDKGDHWRPALCADGDGRLWATWSRNEQGNWDIWGRFLTGDKWSDPVRLTRSPGNDFAQELAMDKDGRLWMTWQSVIDGNYEVLLATVTTAGPGEALNVSRHPASDWEPAITTTTDGRVCVAWDSYRAGSYDILAAELEDGRLSEPIGIATTPAYEAHVTVTADRQERLWFAWDNGGIRWGEDNEDNRTLHSERSVEIRCLDGGRLHEPDEPLSAVLSGPLATYCELPELIADGEGRLWLSVRHLSDLTPARTAGGRKPQARGIWNPCIMCYDGNGWSAPKQLPDSNGRNDMRVRACVGRDGRAWMTWSDDARQPTRAEEPQNHKVHAARLVAPESSTPDPAVGASREAKPAPTEERPAERRALPYSIDVQERRYLLLFGDTHRHTDLSRCGMNFDGSLMDTYRYAIDVARLDFLAISDHDQDLLKHRYHRKSNRLQHYGWWRSEKYCDLFHMDGRFIAIYAYEHGGSFEQRGGHKNILYLDRGNPCYELDSPEELFASLRGKEAIAIPHQLADGPAATDWKKWNPEFERVAEIFQARGSYEFKGAQPLVGVTRDGHYLWDALGMGVKVGIIASSDHHMLSSAYAGVYCTEISRAGVMEGLKNRRTFGSMNRMIIDFRLGDHLLGEEVRIDSPPRFNVRVEAPATLLKIQIVKNGAMIHTVSPDSLTGRFEFVDEKLQPGQEAWYYLRCELEKERFGWSSPIWVGRDASQTPSESPGRN